MSKSEMRFVRREIINGVFHEGWKTMWIVKMIVRLREFREFHSELKAYK